MLKLIGILVLLVVAVIATALFLRRNKKIAAQVDAAAKQAGSIAAQVDAAAKQAGSAIDKATGGKL